MGGFVMSFQLVWRELLIQCLILGRSQRVCLYVLEKYLKSFLTQPGTFLKVFIFVVLLLPGQYLLQGTGDSLCCIILFHFKSSIFQQTSPLSWFRYYVISPLILDVVSYFLGIGYGFSNKVNSCIFSNVFTKCFLNDFFFQ